MWLVQSNGVISKTWWHAFAVRDVSHSYETWLIHMRHDSFTLDMTHSYETWLICSRYDSLFRMRQNSFICDMTHSYETWRIQTDSYVIQIVQTNGVTSKTWRNVVTKRDDMRVLVISIWEYSLFYRSLLQMRPIIVSYMRRVLVISGVFCSYDLCVTWLMYMWHASLTCDMPCWCGVATISRLYKILGLFRRIQSLL